ncbi:hypothetical protein [Parendozoicomonas haliclonae]|uniref:Uncharacterized protein n=1 Tax=Parendozoicomonas haliclonae TaxID=1960125 RepID=A0A1X7AEL2_9GAMM|nr:hypothetical protein [Parendozoicomonas haliclonae]SMA33539.1 hypothetical protein EHSB41UT_00295 [Parendozoicomonas haliclonae]
MKEPVSAFVYSGMTQELRGNANRIRKALGLKQIHDGWVEGQPRAYHNVLYLTDKPPAGYNPDLVFTYEQAMRKVKEFEKNNRGNARHI